MDGIELLYRFMETSSHSPVIGPPHIAIYAAILKCWRDQNKECPVIIYGHSLMEIARIHGRATYHRVLRICRPMATLTMNHLMTREKAVKYGFGFRINLDFV